MKTTALVAILLALSMPALAADQWLCVAEKVTVMFKNSDGEFEAMATDSDKKFVVSEDGLKLFGSDEYYFNAEDCSTTSNEGIRCESNLFRQGFVQVTVFMDSAVFYRYQIIFTEAFVANHTQDIGRCTKI